MPNFTAGTSFTDGVTNDVTAAKLNALIADAVPTSSLSLNSTTGTISNFTSSTANITLGTIPTLTTGTTTGTAATFTTGTLTAGVIPTLTSTTLITSGTGTAASPAIQPTGDTNTGIFFPAADTIAFSEGGTESMRIDSSGKVGIGTTSPDASYRMTVSGSRSAVTPGIIFTDSDATPTNYGLYINGNKSFTIYDSTAGANRLLVDSSGNVGIGVTPSAWGSSFVGLQVGGASSIWTDKTNGLRTFINTNTYFDGTNRKYLGNGAASEYLQGTDGSHAWYSAGSGTAGSNITMSERLRIDSSGNVGIGTTSPAKKLHVDGSNEVLRLSGTTPYGMATNGTVSAFLVGVSDGDVGAFGGTLSNHYYALRTNNAERLRIDSSGNLCIGHSNSTGLINGAWKTMIEGSNCLSVKNTNTSGATTAGFSSSNYSGSVNIINFYRGDGTTLVGTISMTNGSSGTTVAYNTSSDYRLKTNLEPISNGIERVKQLPVYRFNWIEDESGNKVDGFVAHEAQAIVPECVTGEKDAVDADGKPIHQGIDQSKIVPLLTAALKEAIAKIETLEAKVTALEAA